MMLLANANKPEEDQQTMKKQKVLNVKKQFFT
jgi:hypothetical protein